MYSWPPWVSLSLLHLSSIVSPQHVDDVSDGSDDDLSDEVDGVSKLCSYDGHMYVRTYVIRILLSYLIVCYGAWISLSFNFRLLRLGHSRLFKSWKDHQVCVCVCACTCMYACVHACDNTACACVHFGTYNCCNLHVSDIDMLICYNVHVHICILQCMYVCMYVFSFSSHVSVSALSLPLQGPKILGEWYT